MHDVNAAADGSVKKRVLLWFLRLGLGALFVMSGVLKARDPSAFATEVANYQWLPSFPQAAPLIATLLPSLEVILGGALLVGSRAWARAGALLALGLLGVFTVAVTSVVLRGVNISCGCFGNDSGAVTWLTVGRNVVLFASAAWLWGMLGPARERV